MHCWVAEHAQVLAKVDVAVAAAVVISPSPPRLPARHCRPSLKYGSSAFRVVLK
jgi:hypothetical protein